jgi:hypothetical protein
MGIGVTVNRVDDCGENASVPVAEVVFLAPQGPFFDNVGPLRNVVALQEGRFVCVREIFISNFSSRVV